MRRHRIELLRGDQIAVPFECRPFCVYCVAKRLNTHCFYQDLNPSLVFVIATAEQVVNPQNRFKVVEQLGDRNKGLDLLADDRCAAKPAADNDFGTDLAIVVPNEGDSDIMGVNCRSITIATTDRDLEFPR